MLRTAILVSLVQAFNCSFAFSQEDGDVSTETATVAAKQEFDAALQRWQQVTKELKAAYNEKRNAGDPEGTLAETIAEKQKASDAALAEIIAAGLEVFEEDAEGYPTVNNILVRLAGFYVIGDQNGDGGDQYEKALPVIRKLLDGGAGEKWDDLWIWGGASAYCLNEFDLAEEYLAEARKRGLFDNLPAQQSTSPAMLVRQNTSFWLQDIPKIKLRWQREQSLRKQEAESDDLPRVKLVTTKGEIVLELFEKEAPQSVANIITLVKQGYYDGVTFHRVLPLFMAQGGDPEGTGSGGPGYTIRDEHTLPLHRKHFRGSLSMAKTGMPNSGGSQFFLTFIPTRHLDGKHTVFGRVLEGMNNAAALKRRAPSRGYTPEPDKIISAEVLRDRGHSYEFEKLPAR